MSIPSTQPHGVNDDKVAVLKLDPDNLQRNTSSVRAEEDHPVEFVSIVVGGVEGTWASFHHERCALGTDPMPPRRPPEHDSHCIL